MILEMATTGYALSSGLIGGSLLTGQVTEMDSYRKFFLSEKSDIDKILANSREFENKYSIDSVSVLEKVEDETFLDGGSSSGDDREEVSASAVLGSVGSVASSVASSYFNYKYLVIVAVLGFVLSALGKEKRKAF